MFQGNWKCSSCGGAITELPFEPRSEKGLTCRTCYAKGKAEGETPMESATVTGAPADEQMVPDDVSFDEGSYGSAPQEDDGLDAAPAASSSRPMFEGDWKCSVCDGPITSLPFKPRSSEGLKCIDCFRGGK